MSKVDPCPYCGMLVADMRKMVADYPTLRARAERLEEDSRAAKAMIKRLMAIVSEFNEGFEMSIFGALPDGNTAFGCDEGEVRGQQSLEDTQTRYDALVAEWQTKEKK